MHKQEQRPKVIFAQIENCCWRSQEALSTRARGGVDMIGIVAQLVRVASSPDELLLRLDGICQGVDVSKRV